MKTYQEILKKYWGFPSFRDIQADIIHSIGEGKDTLGLMPTGGGKSLTFQVPALAKEGLCIVISPLIALMNDQVEKLRSLGIKAFALNSGLNKTQMNIAIENAVHGAYKLLYVSPERISNEIFKEKIKHANVSFITVDEAHCISQWGYDFRPSYLKITELRKLLPDAPILALTATATKDVVKDIQNKLQFEQENVIKTSFNRENLVYYVKRSDSKLQDLLKIAVSIKGSGIVYLRSRKKTAEVSAFLNNKNIVADFYHAGLSYEDRLDKQWQWLEGKIRIIVATNAFGMGIDKPDVRFVVHLSLPDSLEEYFQEAGRAGRDKKKSFAVLLVNSSDKATANASIERAFPPIPKIKAIYDKLGNFLQVPLESGKGMAYDFNLNDFAKFGKYYPVIAYNALKMVEKHGYIELTDEVNNRSRVFFIVGRDDLYRFQVENKAFDGFIKLILRSYTGLFSDYVRIDEDFLSKKANISRDTVYQYLVNLDKRKIISYIPSKKTPLIIYNEERLDLKSLYISTEFYNERKEKHIEKIEAMLNYAFREGTCRNHIFLEYFGQKPIGPCGQCDVCKSADSSNPALPNTVLKEKIMELLSQQNLTLDIIHTKINSKEEEINNIIDALLKSGEIVYISPHILAINKKE